MRIACRALWSWCSCRNSNEVRDSICRNSCLACFCVHPNDVLLHLKCEQYEKSLFKRLFVQPWHLLFANWPGSVSLNSPFVPSHVIQLELPLSDRSSSKNCHSWIWPDPVFFSGMSNQKIKRNFILVSRHTVLHLSEGEIFTRAG